MLQASISKNDKLAKWLIGIFSVVVFTVVVLLSKFKLDVDLGFDVHIFAKANAVINTIIAVLLVAALVAVKNGNYQMHKQMILQIEHHQNHLKCQLAKLSEKMKTKYTIPPA